MMSGSVRCHGGACGKQRELRGTGLILLVLRCAISCSAGIPRAASSSSTSTKIYNTRMYSQSNTGHEFTNVLTDAERTALIEYLKTL